jgi:hypothetical protein
MSNILYFVRSLKSWTSLGRRRPHTKMRADQLRCPAALLVLATVVLPACELPPQDPLDARAGRIRPGMAKEEVVALLCAPDAVQDNRANMRGQRCFLEYRYHHASDDESGWQVCFDGADRVVDTSFYFLDH